MFVKGLVGFFALLLGIMLTLLVLALFYLGLTWSLRFFFEAIGSNTRIHSTWLRDIFTNLKERRKIKREAKEDRKARIAEAVENQNTK